MSDQKPPKPRPSSPLSEPYAPTTTGPPPKDAPKPKPGPKP